VPTTPSSTRRGLARPGLLLSLIAAGGAMLYLASQAASFRPGYYGAHPCRIGVWLAPGRSAEGFLRVHQLVRDMPAMRAGVLPGDLITSVEGCPVSEISTAEAVWTITGEAETPVHLTILQVDRETPVEITLIRQDIRRARGLFLDE
jgi:C-terminal processing protease CtpA/Prc